VTDADHMHTGTCVQVGPTRRVEEVDPLSV